MKFPIKDIVNEWSYRVDNGMPNAKNPLHIITLSEILKEHNFPNEFIDTFISNLNESEEKLTVHKGQNPTTFYHEVLTALAVAGVKKALNEKPIKRPKQKTFDRKGMSVL